MGNESAQRDELSCTEEERQNTLRSFFKDGKLVQIPAKLKKKLIVFREILEKFELDRDYSEKEVNALIAPICEDFCTVRRYFVANEWMTRQNGVYKRTGK